MGGPYYPPCDDVAYFCRVATFSHVSFVPLNFLEVSPTVFGVKSEPSDIQFSESGVVNAGS